MFGKKCCDTCRTSRVRNHQTMNTVKFIVGFTEQKINSYSVPSHHTKFDNILKTEAWQDIYQLLIGHFLIFNIGDRTHSFQISLRLKRRPKECCSPFWLLNISSLIFTKRLIDWIVLHRLIHSAAIVLHQEALIRICFD